MSKIDIKSLPEERLREQFAALGFPAYRASQVKSWLDKGLSSFAEMTDLPLSLRDVLTQKYTVPSVAVARKLVSQQDGTVKYLFSLSDGETIESVLMRYRYGWSQCLSTQVGCRMGCVFCATGQGGLVRNLLPSEMIGQIERAQEDHGIQISSVVLMGMGEPLDNFDHVMRFLEMVSAPGGVHIGMRRISLSTCGLSDRIEELMRRRLQLTLSISLHAPNDELRQKLMPVAKRYPVDDLITLCKTYAQKTGRRVSYEYAMMSGLNDTPECAEELGGKLRGSLCHVNLIPLNPVAGTPYRRSDADSIRHFIAVLERYGIPVTVRRTLGADIEASCGQLRRREQLKAQNKNAFQS